MKFKVFVDESEMMRSPTSKRLSGVYEAKSHRHACALAYLKETNGKDLEEVYKELEDEYDNECHVDGYGLIFAVLMEKF